ncbi:MAG: PilZ domain-containing protein [Candidatus Omnitrophica bacterium]|nr:PilZ domain-containing protein [Candidatus Omnitrophota bacterium]
MASWHGALIVGFSATGLRAMSGPAFSPGTRLALRFRFPHHPEPYRVLGEVAWSRPVSGLTESGIAFIDVTAAQRDDLNELVQFLLNVPGKA